MQAISDMNTDRHVCSDGGVPSNVVMANDDVTPSSQYDPGATHMDEDEPTTSGRDLDARKSGKRLLPAIAEELCKMVPHPFTLEGCCDAHGTNRVFPQLDYCTPSKSFLAKDVAGEHIYLHPPFKDPHAFLEHVNECYERAPTTTSCVAILPKWSKGRFCQDQLKGWQLLHTFPARTHLFQQEVHGEYVPMRKTHWPVDVWYKAPLPRETYVGAIGQRYPTFICKGKVAHTPASVSIHQSDDGHEKVLQVPDGASVKMILMDSGATDSFVNPRWLARAGYLLSILKQMKSSDAQVKLANGQVEPVLGIIKLPLKIGQYKGVVTLKVLDIGDYDVILGDEWLTSNRAYIDYGEKTCTVRSGKHVYLIRPYGVEEPQPPKRRSQSGEQGSQPKHHLCISAMQVKRLLPKAKEVYWVMVKRDMVEELNSILTEAKAQGLQVDHDDPRLKALIEEFTDRFRPIPPGLPKDRGVGHAIPLTPGAQPPWRCVYKLSQVEKEELAKQLKEMLAAGWIEPSTSPYGAPMLFVRKKDGGLRMCIDYRALNKLTIKNRYPLPRIDDLLDQVGKAKYFTSLDLASGYHQIRITEEDVPKTAFKTPLGHYQWRVLSMGLSNAPSTFQAVMNQAFGEQVGRHVVVYMDDILIFSDSKEEHLEHLRKVLTTLREEDFYCKLAKCEFMKTEINYLGHVVDEHGLRPGPMKVKAVEDWKEPESVHELRSFLGLCNYFRRFIKGYALKTYPMTQLLKKKAWKDKDAFKKDALCRDAFKVIKRALVTAPVLAHYDPTKKIELVCDASKVALGGVLLQEGRPVAYESRKLTSAETRYDTGDRELLAVIHCLKVWRCYLQGVNFTLVTDHKPNTYLKSIDNWSDRQARWYEKLERFNYEWEYRKGTENVADALSRLASIQEISHLHKEVDWALNKMHMAYAWRQGAKEVDPMDHVSGMVSVITRRMQADMDLSNHEGDDLSSRMPAAEALVEEAETKRMQRKAKKVQLSLKRIINTYNSPEWKDELERGTTTYTLKPNGLWYMGDRIAIPPGASSKDVRDELIKEHHDIPIAGHQGFDRTRSSLARCFWWRGLYSDVERYCKECVSCQANKSGSLKHGSYQPLPVPDTPWHTMTMDFMTGLPETEEGYDTLVVFVDKLTKLVHMAPTCKKGLTAEEVANLFLREVFRHHGVPQVIISDRDTRLTSAFWREVMTQLGSKCKYSTAFHPQTDGQTEVYNKVVEQMMRNFVSPTMTNWAELLPTCEFALNSHVHKGTKYSPFFLTYGRHPARPLDRALSTVEDPLGLSTVKDPLELQEDDLMELDEDDGKSGSKPSGKEAKEGKVAAKTLQEALRRAKQSLEEANMTAKTRADKGLKEVTFAKDDLVWLSSKNFTWKYGAKKLCPRFLGPFPIKEVLGPVTYRLELPDDWRMHDVFHVSVLKRFTKGPNYKAPKPVKVVEDEPQWEVEAIVDTRSTSSGATDYLVHWRGFGREWQSWIPEENLAGSPSLLRKYWRQKQRNPDYGRVDDSTHV